MYHQGDGAPFLQPDSNYWPNWESHYAPIEKSRSRLHRRNHYAPPAYSASIGPSAAHRLAYSNSRRTLLDAVSPLVPNSLRRAEALLSLPSAHHALASRYAAAAYPIPLAVRYEVKSVEATVVWDTPAFRAREPAYFTYLLYMDGGERQEKFELANWKTRLTLPLSPGTYYQVTVDAVTPERVVIARGTTEFKAVFDANELRNLYDLALAYLRPLNEKANLSGMQRFYIFYRNKPTAYFDHVRLNDHGIMKKYRKDDNGHPASAINGEIDGLFFNARQPGGQVPKTSPFGNVRLSVPAEYLFTPSHSLYFCDFYCNNSTHYITVVACLPGSLTDQYCRRWLMPLDPTSNKFLFACINPYTGEMEHYVNGSIWVEFYYTEDIPLSWGFFDTVFSTGQSKPNGVPNNKACKICNLYPIVPAVVPASAAPDKPKATKRRASSDDATDEMRKRPSLLERPVSAADFARSRKRRRRSKSTFHLAMELQRKKAEEDGQRMECEDPSIIELVCHLVDEVSKEDVSPQADTSSADDDVASEHDDGYGSAATSTTSPLQRSTSSAADPESPASSSLPDKEFIRQTEALVAFNNGKDLISKLVRDVGEAISDAKKTTEGLCKKILKLDQ